MTRRIAKNLFATIEFLERRELLSADTGTTGQLISPAAVGINMNVNDTWRTSALWVNTANQLSRWGKFNDPASTNPNLTLTADGYPLQSASSWMQLKGYPDGIYKLSFEGAATVTVSSMGSIVPGSIATVGNVTTANVLVDHSAGSNLIISVSGLNAANPLHNLKLIMPGYAVDTTQVFNTKTLQRIGAFGTIRAMDMVYSNINTDTNWADRTLPTSFLQTSSGGVAYEDIIALANATDSNLWINIPVNATDDYVTQLARLLRDQLEPGLKVHVEYGNELWHNGFYSGQTNYAKAQANNQLTSNFGNGRAGQQEAFKLKTFYDIFTAEYGAGQSSRYGFVFAGHPDINDRFNTEAFSFIQQKYGTPYFLEAFSRGMYINISDAQDVDGMSMDQLFTALESNLPALSADVLAAKAFANQYGLKFFIYEGGQHLTANNFRNQSLKIAAQTDSRMGVLYQRLLDLAAQDGVDLFMHYGYADPSTQFGSWGLLESTGDVGSVKWDQLLNNILQRGDANLDHAVNFSDFVILRDSYNATQQPGYIDHAIYWQQGDFNQDRAITAADYFIWKAKATGLSTAEQNEAAAFEATLASGTATKPVVTVVASDAAASEPVAGQPANKGTYTFTRTGDVTNPLTVNYSLLSGTATLGSDYLTSTGSLTLTFAAGASTATLDITALADTLLENNETVVLVLYEHAGYTLGAATTATVTIADNFVPGTPVVLTGTVFGTAGSYQNNNNTKEKAFDGLTGTNFDGPGPDNNIVGIDLGAGVTKQVTSIRFFPRVNWAGRMKDGIFQGSIDGTTWTQLYKIPSNPAAGWNTVTVNNTTGFRYLRYVSPAGSYGNVAEIEFYGVTPPDVTPPTTPGTPTFVSNTASSITFSWAASTDAGGVTHYDVYRNGTLVGSPTGNTFTDDTGLDPETSYTYTVKAYDAANNPSALSASAALATAVSPDVTPPTAPGAPALVTKSYNYISINWDVSNDLVGVTGYEVYRNDVLIDTSITNSYTNEGLNESTSYAYKIRAYDAAGNFSAFGAATTIATDAAPDLTPPATPAAPTLVSKTYNAVSITWAVPTDNVGVVSYEIYRDGLIAGTNTTNSFNDGALTGSTTYIYTIKAFDAAGNGSLVGPGLTVTTDAPPDVTPPSKPTGLTPGTKTDVSVSFTWTASTDNVGVTKYEVYRDNVLVGSPTTNAFSETGLTGSTTYVYTVKAFDLAGNPSELSNPLSIQTNVPPDVTPPSKPTGLALVSKTDVSVSFNWTASTDNIGVTKYEVYRNGVLAGSPTTNSFSESGLSGSTTYNYTVKAFDLAGNPSALSDVLGIQTNASPDVTPPSKPTGLSLVSKTDVSVSFNWTASTDNVGVTKYEVYRNSVLVGSPTTNAFSESGLAGSTTYVYTVKAFDLAGNPSALSDTLSITTNAPPDLTPPTTPGVPTLVSRTTTSITFNWTASTDAVGVTKYEVYRGATLIGSPTTNSITDTNLTAGTSYTYSVKAFDLAGNSSTSSTASISTDAAPAGPVALSGTVFGTAGSYQNNGMTIANAFDGNTATYYDGANANPNVLGLNFGSAKVITKITFTPRPPRVLNGVTTTWGFRMVGGKFEASNDANFTAGTVTTLYSITTDPGTGGQVTINNPTAFQYVRYVAPTGSYGNVAEITFFGTASAPADTTPPSKPTNLVAGTPTMNTTSFTWTASTDNVAVTKYEVYRGATLVGSPTTANFSDSSLAPSTAYTYTVKAFDAAGNSSVVSDPLVITTTADTVAPTTPGTPTLVIRTTTSITFSFAASTDNIGVTKYEVYRGATLIGSPTTNANVTDTGLTAGTAYTYTVKAFDAAGNMSAIASGSISTNAADTTAPTTPGTPTLVSRTATSITFSFAASTDNVGVTKYEVYRGATLIGSPTTNANVTDSGLTANTAYTYTVKAFDAAGNISAIASASISTTASTPTSTKLTGTVFGTAGSYNNSGLTIDKAFDADPTSYYDGANANGNILGLSFGSAKTITKISYTPRPPKIVNGNPVPWGSRMVGGRFEASTTANFAAGTVTTLYTITSAPTGTVEVNISNPGQFLYFRYVAPDGSYGNVGDISVFGY